MALKYPDMVQRLRSVLLILSIACGAAAVIPASASQEGRASAPKDQMFSGTVTAISETSLTAVRNGSKDSKTFVLTPETRFEGERPQVNSRVTIRYVAAEGAERAVRIIVRSPARK